MIYKYKINTYLIIIHSTKHFPTQKNDLNRIKPKVNSHKQHEMYFMKVRNKETMKLILHSYLITRVVSIFLIVI
jgi:hypothetical protein